VMRALEVAGSILGKDVLVTGGSGGVGQLAIQLAVMSGARVTAVSSSADRRVALRALGAHAAVADVGEADGPFAFVLESVGGSSLASAIEKIAPGGVVVTIGNSSEEETVFNPRTLYAKGAATIYGLIVFEELDSRRIGAHDLRRLLDFVAAGRLQPKIERRRDWTDLPSLLAELENRSFSGKAVLTIE
ncbi:MAG: zinc-binding dehydrogenase, partial [Thermoanaerobaculia bacterium]